MFFTKFEIQVGSLTGVLFSKLIQKDSQNIVKHTNCKVKE